MNALASLVELTERLAVVAATGRMEPDAAERTLNSAFDHLVIAAALPAEPVLEALNQETLRLAGEEQPHATMHAALVWSLARSQGSPYWQAATAHTLGNALKRDGQEEAAAELFRLAVARFGDQHPAARAVAQGDLGAAFFRLGRLAEAEGLLRLALADARRSRQVHNQLEWLLTLGNTLNALGRYREAESLFAEGAALAAANGRLYHRSACLTGQANVFENLGRYEESRALHEQAFALSRQLDDPTSLFHDHLNFGNLAMRFHRHSEAIEHYGQALKLAQGIGNPQWRTLALNALGTAHLAAEDLEQALANLEQSEAVARQAGNAAAVVRALGNRASVLFLAGRPEEALRLHGEAAELSRAIEDPVSLAQDLINLSLVHRHLGQAEAAVAASEEAVAVAEGLGSPGLGGSAQRSLALSLSDLPARHAEVWPAFERAMGLLESFRQHVRDDSNRIDLYSGGQSGLYEAAVAWLLGQGDTRGAFAAAERSKARLTLDLLEEGVGGGLSQPEDAQALGRRASRLGPNAALVSFFGAEEDLWAFLLDPATGVVEAIPLAWSLTRLRSWHEVWQGLTAPLAEPTEPIHWSRPEAERALHELHRGVLEPVLRRLQELPAVDRLWLVPHGLLHGLPLHASLDGDGRYLVQRFVVSYLPALQMLGEEASEGSGGSRPALVIGAAEASRGRLPGADREARAVSSLLGTEPLLGPEASRENVLGRLPAAAWIHFSGHGFFDAVSPGLAHLCLAGGERLTAAEIARLDLPNLHLVVMAACESLRSRRGGIDEALGLPRAWQVAGARFVLGGLWLLDDESARALQIELYRAVLAGQGLAEALATAQRARAARDDLEGDPRLWAAYQLWGPTGARRTSLH